MLALVAHPNSLKRDLSAHPLAFSSAGSSIFLDEPLLPYWGHLQMGSGGV